MKSSLRDRVSAFICHYGLVDNRLAVAVSGGPDSVCLIHLLAGLKDELGLDLHIAHLDHQLRTESPDDACYVKLLAASLGLPVTLGQADVQGYHRQKKLTVEESARIKRYEFLAGVAENIGAINIAIAHTRDDHVETVLMHLIRGAGTRGLVGLRPLTPWTVKGRQVILVRPMLEISRQETQDYCRVMGLKPRIDSSNQSLAPLRNQIRLKLLPRLKSYNPGIDRTVVRLSRIAQVEQEYLENQMMAAWSRIVRQDVDIIMLDKQALLALPVALQHCLLRRALEESTGTLKDIEARHIEDIMSTLCLPAGRHIDLPYGLTFSVDYACYWLGRSPAIPSPFPPLASEYRVNVPGVNDIPGWQVTAAFVKAPDVEVVNGLVAHMDATKISPVCLVRNRQPADSFQPLGMASTKKIGEFMIATKIPRRWRENIPLVTSAGHIVWLVGYRIDERVKVTPASQRVVRLEFKPL